MVFCSFALVFWFWFICLSRFLVPFTCLNSFLFLLICFSSCIGFKFTSICVFLIHKLVKGKDYYQVVRKCLGLISSLWDHHLRHRPFSSPKNTCIWFLHGLWSLLFNAVVCSPALVFSVIFILNRLHHVPHASLHQRQITNKPSQSLSDSLFFPSVALRGVHHSLYELYVPTVDLPRLIWWPSRHLHTFRCFKPPPSICLAWSDYCRFTRSPTSLANLHCWSALPNPTTIVKYHTD